MSFVHYPIFDSLGNFILESELVFFYLKQILFCRSKFTIISQDVKSVVLKKYSDLRESRSEYNCIC